METEFVLLDGEVIFFEISDAFPRPGNYKIVDGDFWDNVHVPPSKLPANEYAIVRQQLCWLLHMIGLKPGIFRREARVQDSSMAFSTGLGLIDLRSIPNTTRSGTPRCVLIEVNSRLPDLPCVLATVGAYGVDMYDLHLLSSLGEHERFQALTKPFWLDTANPNHARAWSEIVFF